jgi:hypothetical protein
MTFLSKAITQLEHMKLQARIPIVDARVGHVLEPIAHTQIINDFEMYAHMTYELNGPPKVFLTESMFTQNCGTDPSAQHNETVNHTQGDTRADRANEACVPSTPESTG